MIFWGTPIFGNIRVLAVQIVLFPVLGLSKTPGVQKWLQVTDPIDLQQTIKDIVQEQLAWEPDLEILLDEEDECF